MVNEMDPTFFCRYTALYCAVILALVQSQTIYISSSNSGPCTSGLCLTLNQLAQTATSVIGSGLNVTLVFLPGNHLLNSSPFTVAGIRYLSMISNTGDNSKHIIRCDNSSNFQFKFNCLVHISGLSLSGCLENEVHEVDEFTIENCHLIGAQEALGRAFVATNSTVHIEKSHFTRFGSHKGGAIYCSLSSIGIYDCVFTKNCAANGGALYVEGNSDVTIVNTTFSQHGCSGSVTSTNRSIDDDNCFHLENFTATVTGGVLSVFESNVSVLWSTFAENIASNGGAVYCHRGAFVNASNVDFSSNKATTYGGVFYQLDCDIHISESNFSKNSGSLGGVFLSQWNLDNRSSTIGR